MGERVTMLVEIGNLTPAQREAVADLLATWVHLGSVGASRWTAFYADGDGNFRPRIVVNGAPPAFTPHISTEEKWPNGHSGDYKIDFDKIAWRMRDEAPVHD